MTATLAGPIGPAQPAGPEGLRNSLGRRHIVFKALAKRPMRCRDIRSIEGRNMARQRSIDWRRHLPSATLSAIALLVLAILFGGFVFSGFYNIGADAPHSRIVAWTLEQVRDRAVIHHAGALSAPADLRDPTRVAAGAGLYAEMCSGCHLAPGMAKTEISQGLYPSAPEFAHDLDRSPAEAFWAIKHGVKLSAMPAWGKTHDDRLIWDMVAFLQKLPTLSPQQYQALVKSAPEDHDEMMEHMHGADADAPHDHH
uniref:c-type cytochrome n=1 Tax=Sphingomonas bacterium TaxID=1895847 RepID=UPI002619FCF4|nr:cytochrome c [Sphingomonas bacterium]